MSMKIHSFAGALKPLAEKKSAGQDIFELLKQAITCGDISPGSRMVENHIAQIMGVSRTPVREAIHKLEREGLLTKQRHGGYNVTGLTRQDIEESFGIRAVLEGYAARLATLAHTEEDLKALLRKIDEYEKALHAGDLEALPTINTEMHDMLYSLSRNRTLIKIINDLKDQFLRFRKIILKNQALALASHHDHREMLAMMQRRQAEEVERLVREHILRGLTAVLDQYDQDQLDPLA
jgi:DNA-binding GntR family transcriptional regulator